MRVGIDSIGTLVDVPEAGVPSIGSALHDMRNPNFARFFLPHFGPWEKMGRLLDVPIWIWRTQMTRKKIQYSLVGSSKILTFFLNTVYLLVFYFNTKY